MRNSLGENFSNTSDTVITFFSDLDIFSLWLLVNKWPAGNVNTQVEYLNMNQNKEDLKVQFILVYIDNLVIRSDDKFAEKRLDLLGPD